MPVALVNHGQQWSVEEAAPRGADAYRMGQRLNRLYSDCDSQAQSAGSIPVARSVQKPQV
ncbi:hypothetical protein GCM10009801_46050 [Streptomyces albiaxialis]|uniref:Uncharacterized protein n=1 Tax=Streptomyces albiaxialis TaxID=329523 RepID=A0ABP5HTK2_9ACTN